jgi:phenylalanyl-tRNA synthetase beta chain
MPTIELKIDRLEKLVGKELDFDKLQYDLQWISLDVDDFNKEENTIKVEYSPNRPDFSSPEGIARALKGYYDIEKGIPPFEIIEGTEVMHVDAKVRKVRPYVVCGIVRDIELDDDQVKTMMNIQEALHLVLGRDRKKVAIGIHDYDQVKGPYRYTTEKPDAIRFRPLHMEAYEMTPKEILEEHDMGKQYAHLLDGFEEYPMIYDAEGKVVSFPPIINGVYTTVTDKTKNLLLDLTGTSFEAVSYSINIIATMFADMGAKVESVKVIYEDEPDKAFFTPDLTTRKWKANIAFLNSYIGLNLKPKEMIECLRKVRLDAKLSKDKKNLDIEVPAYRVDIMHEVDFTEEVAIGYGYKNLPITIKEGGFGAYHPAVNFGEHTRKILIGCGCLEMVNSILSSRKDLEKMGLKFSVKNNIDIANPVSEEYNTTRNMLLIGLMKNLENNRSAEKPFRLFEVGDIVVIDKSQDTGARRELHTAAVVHSDTSDYTEIKSILDHYFRTINVLDEIEIKPLNSPTFIEGRAGEIIYKKQKIGSIGEFNPEVIIKFGLEYPTAGFELDLSPFWKKE